MSWQASAYISKLIVAPNGEKLTRSEKLLALLLADRHNPDYDIAWPSVTKLAAEAMLSERRARDLLHSLAKKGVITIERRWVGPQQCDTNLYRFPGLTSQGGGAISSPRRKLAPAHHCPRVGQPSLPQGGAIATAPKPSMNLQRTDSGLLSQQGEEARPQDLDPHYLTDIRAILRQAGYAGKTVEG
jgi:hypothetical protein